VLGVRCTPLAKVWGLASRQALRTAVHAKGVPVTGLLLAPKVRAVLGFVSLALSCSSLQNLRVHPTQAALAPLRAATAVSAARARLLPIAPFAKYATDAPCAGAKPWEGPPVLLMGGGAGPADEQQWVRASAACGAAWVGVTPGMRAVGHLRVLV
jgi:hypothetical protein